MKLTLTSILLALTATTTLASPVVDIQVGATSGFVCPARVNAFCHASNVHSGCTPSGEFRSDAMDTCGECKCL